MSPSSERAKYGWHFWKFRVIRDNDVSFGRLVARQCYNLTHEYVLNRLYESQLDTRFTGNTDAAWMELDRAVKEFADRY